jgi:hypothetical protein
MTRTGDRGDGRTGPSPLELLRRAMIICRELGRRNEASVAPSRSPAAETERWRAIDDAAFERSTARGWRVAAGKRPALDAIGGALLPEIVRDFEVTVYDPRGVDTGERAKFTAREAPRLVRSGRTAALYGAFDADTKARKLRFSVRADAIDAVAPRRVTWVAPVKHSRCDLAAAARAPRKIALLRAGADGHTGDTIAYLDPDSIEVTRVRR